MDNCAVGCNFVAVSRPCLIGQWTRVCYSQLIVIGYPTRPTHTQSQLSWINIYYPLLSLPTLPFIFIPGVNCHFLRIEIPLYCQASTEGKNAPSRKPSTSVLVGSLFNQKYSVPCGDIKAAFGFQIWHNLIPHASLPHERASSLTSFLVYFTKNTENFPLALCPSANVSRNSTLISYFALL